MQVDARDQDLSYVQPDGVWCRAMAPPTAVPRPCLFLDRDGVLIEERHYLSKPEDVALIDGGGALIARARQLGWAVAIVTNQSGIGRGKFDWQAYAAVEARMLTLLAGAGAQVDMILACPHHPSKGQAPYDRDHDWRKPRPGMLFAAAVQLNLELGRSVIVGDKASDLEAGRTARLAKGFHVTTGHGHTERAAALALATSSFEIVPCRSVADVAHASWLQ